MTETLGYKKFAVESGDWGIGTASVIGQKYPSSVYGIHLNLLFAPKPVIGERPFGRLSAPFLASIKWKVIMQKIFFATVAVASLVTLSSGVAYSGSYPFGDTPYRLDFGDDPRVDSGCLRWNWQQYQWEDHCPIYVYPKAYMYPRFQRQVLRTRG